MNLLMWVLSLFNLNNIFPDNKESLFDNDVSDESQY